MVLKPVEGAALAPPPPPIPALNNITDQLTSEAKATLSTAAVTLVARHQLGNRNANNRNDSDNDA